MNESETNQGFKPPREQSGKIMLPSQNPIRELTPAFGIFAPAFEYFVDAAQRSVLYWDVMRQRGNQYREHLAKTAPHVLDYEVDLIIDGRTLERPVTLTKRAVPSLSSTPVPDTALVSAASRPTARLVWRLRRGILAISWASCLNPCLVKQSRMWRAQRRHFSKE